MAIEIDQNLTVIIAVIVVLATLVIFWLLKKSPSSKKYVLILGASNAGKTALFSQLVYKKALPTQISIKENKGVIDIEKLNKQIDLVDIPGFGNIRYKFIEQYKKISKGIIFVVDSENFTKECKDVALYLHDILTDEAFSKSRLPIMVACNKQDIDLAKSELFIKSSLEKEIETLRKTSSAALSSTSGDSSSGNKKLILNSKSSNFEFKELKTIKVDFCECNCTTSSESNDSKSSNIAKISAWLETIA